MAAYRIHCGLLGLNQDSRMYVGQKLSQDPTVLGEPSTSYWPKIANKIDQLPVRFFSSTNNNLRSPAWFSSKIIPWNRVKEADIVQLHWICGGLLNIQELLQVQEKIIFWRLADMWAFRGTEHFSNSAVPNNILENWSLRQKKTVYRQLKYLNFVVPSKWMGEKLKSSSLYIGQNVFHVPTGIDTDFFKPINAVKKRQIKAELCLDPDKKLILFGALSAGNDLRKGFGDLADLPNAFSNDKFEFAAFGISSEGMAGWRCFPNLPQKDLLRLYQVADIFLVVSREENLANTAIEAMACGVPVISYDVGGMSDLVKNRENGFLVKDKIELGQMLNQFFQMSPQMFKEHARYIVENEFNQTVQAKRYLALFEVALSSKKS